MVLFYDSFSLDLECGADLDSAHCDAVLFLSYVQFEVYIHFACTVYILPGGRH